MVVVWVIIPSLFCFSFYENNQCLIINKIDLKRFHWFIISNGLVFTY